MTMMQPAYTSVAARQTLSRPSPTKPAQENNWSTAVRNYVQRALGANVPSVSQEDMLARLKSVLTAKKESGEVEYIDWATFPLPHELILHERAHAHAMTHSHLFAAAAAPPPLLPLPQGNPPVSNTHLGKRKSGDHDTFAGDVTTPPWKKPATNLEDRITGQPKSKKQKKAVAFQGLDAQSDAIKRRQERFGIVPANATASYIMPTDEVSTGPVVGTCQKLEKRYLRLTAAPKPEEVRPVPVLTEMLSVLRKKWRSDHNYAYTCDQFKSLRQDLTVQHVQTEFTVKVYEAHARIALEMGDLGEYNQCQTQLRALYKKKLGGNAEEFTAYRILYFIYTHNRADMNNALADLTEADKAKEGVRHALKVRAAVATGNYHKFFKLYRDTPNMGAYLLDKCLPRQRLAALDTICRAYKPDVPLSFLVHELAFNDDDNEDEDHGARACVQFICDNGGEQFISKKDDGTIRFLSGKAGRTFEQARQNAFSKVDLKGQI